MMEMNAAAAGTELDAARDAGREGVSAGWCAWSAGDASLTFSLVVRPDVNMHAFHGLPFVAAMGMMDALVGTASTPGRGLAGKGGIQWPSDIACGAPAGETSLARVTVNGGAGAAGIFGAVTVDIERSTLSELGVDMADKALVEALAAAVLVRVDTWAAAANTPQGAAGPLAPVLGEYFDMSFRPRPYGFADCNARRPRSKIAMTTRPSSAVPGRVLLSGEWVASALFLKIEKLSFLRNRKHARYRCAGCIRGAAIPHN